MLRLVSLIASATEIVHRLGLTSSQVGRSHECDFPAAVLDLPICTRPAFDICGDSRQIDNRVRETLASASSVYHVDSELLERLQPTHIITQTQCQVCAVSLADIEAALSSSVSTRPTVVALEPNSLDDIWSDIARVADACGVGGCGQTLLADLQARMESVAEKTRDIPPRRVACIEWIEPLMAAGNWTPELVERAGGEEVIGRAAHHSPYMDWQQLHATDPEVIVIAPCGFDINRTRSDLHWLTERQSWSALDAVRRGHVYIADGNHYFNRPGPRVVETLEALAQMLHPELFPPTLERVVWERI